MYSSGVRKVPGMWPGGTFEGDTWRTCVHCDSCATKQRLMDQYDNASPICGNCIWVVKEATIRSVFEDSPPHRFHYDEMVTR
jgi:hypothetical protein